MAKITTLETRYAIKQMIEAGQSTKSIAQAQEISCSTVKKWRRRIREERLESQIGRPPGGALSSFDPVIRNTLKACSKAHPAWGPISLRLELTRMAATRLPSHATIARFLREHGSRRSYQPHAGIKVAGPSPTQRVHECWQVDAEGNRSIAHVGPVAIINVKDVHSRLYAGSYPAVMKSPRGHPATAHYQTGLRLAFAQFGLPERIQCDHASVFYENTTASPFPTRIHLWLAALGVELCYSRIHQATDQAHVERTHQTIVSQVIDGAVFPNWEALTDRLDQRRHVLNTFFPCSSLDGQAPLQAFPEAAHTRRPYYPEKEAQMLDMERAFALIAQGTYFRGVSKDHTLSLGGHIYYVPKATPRKQVRITFDAPPRQVIFHDDKEHVLSTMPIKGITPDELMGPLWPAGVLPNFQLELPLDWKAQVIHQGSRLFDHAGGSRLNET